MSQKKRGYQFEHDVASIFSNAGYYVILSRNSMGTFDFLAVKDGITFGVQCKFNNHIRPNEITAMKMAFKTFGIIPLYAYKNEKSPLILKDLLNDKIINIDELPELPKKYVDTFQSSFH